MAAASGLERRPAAASQRLRSDGERFLQHSFFPIVVVVLDGTRESLPRRGFKAEFSAVLTGGSWILRRLRPAVGNKKILLVYLVSFFEKKIPFKLNNKLYYITEISFHVKLHHP